MTTLSDLPRIMHNPALGAGVLRGFMEGWAHKPAPEIGVPLPLLFLPIPLVLHAPTAQVLDSTQQRSGLVGLIEGNGKLKSDVYSFHERVFAFRELSMESFAMALANGLLILDSQSGQMLTGPLRVESKHIPERIRGLISPARSLGRLCQGRSLGEISLHLRVYF